MKNSSRIYFVAALLLLAAVPQMVLAGAPVWSGVASPNLNWTTGGDWTGTGTGTGGIPGTGDTVTFGNAGTGAAGTVDNIVNNSFAAAIGSLTYNNTANFHTTQIAAGTTLTDNGALTESGAGTNAITGAGGTLTVNAIAANFVVGSSQAVTPGLDLSGLDTFTVTIKQIQIAFGGSFNGTLMLARTNTITTAGGSAGNAAALVIGGASSSTAVGTGKLYLGQSNVLFLDGIMLGSSKSGGDAMSFNTAFSSPVAYIRGISGGTSRVTKWALGDNSISVGSGTPGNNFTADFSAGTLDAMANTVIVGQGGNSSGTQRTTAGTFLIGAGTLDANTLYLGAIGSGTGAGAGTMNINGGTLKANTTLELGHTGGASGTTAGNTKGTLNVTNGNVLAGTLAIGANSGAGIIALTSSSLAVSNTLGSSGTLLNTLAVTNSILNLVPGSSSAANAYVNTLALGGSNVLNVISNSTWVTPVVINSYPTTLHVIQYSAEAGGTNFVLGPLPSLAGVALQGYLSDSGSSIDLVITNGPVIGAPTTDTWSGTLDLNNPLSNLDGNWSTNSSHTNWLIQQLSALGAYRNLDTVVFDDSAYVTNVMLAGPLSPTGIAFNNNSSNYLFSGSGSLVGVFGLALNGTAAVTLRQAGLDSFNGGIMLSSGGALLLDNNPGSSISGGLTLNGGIVQVGNNDANGSIPTGGITNNGTLAFARTDSVLVANAINGSGNLTNNGSGMIILAGANSYAGNTVNNAGTLQVGNGGTTGALGQSSIINNGTLIFNLSANATVTPDISGTGPLIQNGSGRLALANTETYTGNTIVNAGTLALTNSASILNSTNILINNATLDVSSFAGSFTVAANQTLLLNHGSITGSGLLADGAAIGMTNATFTIPVSGTPGIFSVTNSTLRFTVTNAFASSSISVTNLVLGGATNSITLTLPSGFQSYPIQLPVIHYTNLVLATSFNLGLTALPAGFVGYASNNVANSSVDVVLAAGPFGASLIWSGTASPNLNWSAGGAGGNWNGLQPPAATDSPVFGDTAVVGTQGQVDNIVDQNFTVNSLTYNNVAGFHTTQIPTGNTLTVNGLSVGLLTGSGSLTTFASMSGGGTLKQTNGAIRMQNFGNGSSLATLDLSGLSNFVFSSTNVINLGVGNQCGGTLVLGATNNISLLASGGRQLEIGDAANGNSGQGGKLFLGSTNTISVDTIYCGGTKQSGTIAFNSGLVNPFVSFRGIGGANSRVSVWSLGDLGAGTISSGTPAALEATNDFTAGTVDALVDLMVVGQGASGSGTKTTAAGLAFGPGTFDVNTLYIGAVGSQASETGIGSVEVVGGTPASGKPNLRINTQIILGTTNVINTGVISGPASGVTGTYGTLTIDAGATVVANTILAGGTANANNGVVVNGGSLAINNNGVIGAAGALISMFTLNNSALTLTPSATLTNANIGTLNLGGTTNVINIASFPAVSYPATFTLATYTNLLGSFNIGLGTIPAGSYTSAYITNDTGALAVKLVLAGNVVPPAPPVITSVSISGGNVILSGTNGAATGNYHVLSTTNVALPRNQWVPIWTNQFDNAGNFSVTLTNATTGGPSQFYLLQLVP